MSEARSLEAMAGAPAPHTVESLSRELGALGVRPGMIVIVHASLRALGWVCGGVEALGQALRAAVGPEGTLVVPTMTTHLSDPRHWQHPPVPQAWWPTIRAHMPAFDPATTPGRMMGALSEWVRTHPGTQRSRHPCVSFAALGPHASVLVDGHALDEGLGEGSPLAHLYALGGHVLLLGVGHARNSSLHLAEARACWPSKGTRRTGGPACLEGQRVWLEWDEQSEDYGDFDPLGAAFEAACPEAVRQGRVGSAHARLVEQRALVDFAVEWIGVHRT